MIEKVMILGIQLIQVKYNPNSIGHQKWNLKRELKEPSSGLIKKKILLLFVFVRVKIIIYH